MTKRQLCNDVRIKAVLQTGVEDLECFCGVVSFALHLKFKQQGIKSRVMFGKYDGYAHCWVESGGYLYDLTATQFNDNLPEVYVFRLKEKKKHKYEDTKIFKSIKDFRGWPRGQKPYPAKLKAILTHKAA